MLGEKAECCEKAIAVDCARVGYKLNLEMYMIGSFCECDYTFEAFG